MKNNITELVFILDRSGSMSGLERDTIGGFNSMLEKQKREPGQAYVSTYLFDNTARLVHDRVPVREVPAMTEDVYFVGGCTALLDAIGEAIDHIKAIHRYARPEDVPAHTLFVITTDGMENASHRYSADRVKAMIGHEKEKYGWEFLFLGANIDAVETAGHIGISADRAVTFRNDSVGIATNYEAVTDAVSAVRASQPLPPTWKARIEKDRKKRG